MGYLFSVFFQRNGVCFLSSSKERGMFFQFFKGMGYNFFHSSKRQGISFSFSSKEWGIFFSFPMEMGYSFQFFFKRTGYLFQFFFKGMGKGFRPPKKHTSAHQSTPRGILYISLTNNCTSSTKMN